MKNNILVIGSLVALLIVSIFLYNIYNGAKQIKNLNDKLQLELYQHKKEKDSINVLLNKSTIKRDSLNKEIQKIDSIITNKNKKIYSLNTELSKIKGKYSSISDDSLYNLIKQEYGLQENN